MPCLAVSKGDSVLKEYAFPHLDLIAIGRAQTNDIVLPYSSRSISRFHAAVIRFADSDRGYFVRDLGSGCGIQVNGVSVERQALRNGDLIQIADYKLQYFSRNEPKTRSAPLRVVRVKPQRGCDHGTTDFTNTAMSREDLAPPERRELLEELGRQAARKSSVTELASQTMKLLLPVFHADRGFIRMFSANFETYDDLALMGTKSHESIEITDALFMESLSRGEPVLDETTLLAPILAKNTLVGFFCLDRLPPTMPFSSQDASFLITLGKQLSVRFSALPDPQNTSSSIDSFQWPIHMVSKSREMEKLAHDIRHAAASDINVLLVGATGTGKEMVAREIHQLSRQGHGSFVVRNCGQITESLAETDIFGYAPKSGIAGARQEGAPGWFQLANGGTLFLDEIHTLSPVMQDQFLRVLQEKEVRPYGAPMPIPVDVKIVAATSEVDLEAAMQQGAFRKPLYFRFGIKLHLPPLRQRKEDIPLLAYYFLDSGAQRLGASTHSISRRALRKLAEYDWPGNVRELQNLIEKAIHKEKEILFSWDLDPAETARNRSSSANPEKLEFPTSSKKVVRPMADVEKEKIMEALEATHGNISQTAVHLGFSRQTLVNKMDSYNIPRNYGDLANSLQ